MSRLPVTYEPPTKPPSPGLTATRLFLALLLSASIALLAFVLTVT
ncbi:MAG: hypothetical protein V4759_00350 [Pseudomonadota bacterium]